MFFFSFESSFLSISFRTDPLTAGGDFSATPAAFDAVSAFDLVSFASLVGGALTGGPEEPFFGGVVGLLEERSLGGLNASIGPLSSVAADPP